MMNLSKKNDLVEYPILVPPRLWRRAGFVGLGTTVGGRAPVLGLMFTDALAAAELFEHWHSIIGKADVDDVLRVSIVLGGVMGLPEAFFFRLAPNHSVLHDKAASALKEDGVEGLDINIVDSDYEVTHQF